MCLHGLGTKRFKPSDIQRATQIFDAPSFFIEGADSSDIVQGKLGDCWFLSALSTMSTAQGLVEKFCVAVSIPTPSSIHSLIGTGYLSETNLLECMDLSSSDTMHGLLSSLTSKDFFFFV